MSRFKPSRKTRTAETADAGPRRPRISVIGILLVAIPLAALALQVYRTRPFIDDVPLALSRGDDWFFYKNNALDIIHNGIEIPRERDEYTRPAGFLYAYFVAAVFAVLGENATMVYIVQRTLLGVAIVVLFLAFRAKFPPWLLHFVLLLQVLLMYFEMGPWFSRRLLSENLLCILVPWATLFLVRAWRSGTTSDLVVAGILTGLCHLARPNALMMMPFGAIVLGAYMRGRGIALRRCVGLFLLGAALAQTPLIARNLYVTRRVSPATFSPVFYRTKDWAYFAPALGFKESGPRRHADRTTVESSRGTAFFAKRILFVTGIETYDGPVIHWMLMWAGVALFAGISVRRRRLDFEDALLAAMIAALLGPLAAAGALTSYGARFLIAGTPLVLLLSLRGVVLAIDEIRSLRESRG